MNIFILRADGDRYQNLIFTLKKDLAIVKQFGNTNLLSSWSEPAVEVFRGDKLHRNLPPSDFPSLTGVPVFSARAVNALQRLLRQNGEILPLSCSEGEYYAFNLTTSIDALDESNSKVERFRSDGSIMQINEFVFLSERFGGAAIFKIPQSKAKIFVTDRFRKMVMDNGLLGFEFVNVWKG